MTVALALCTALDSLAQHANNSTEAALSFNPYPQRPARRSPNVQLLAPRRLDNGVALTAQQEAVLSTTNLNEKVIVIAAAAG
jgi:hypothetical protein